MEMNLLATRRSQLVTIAPFQIIRVLEREKGWPGLACNYKLLKRLLGHDCTTVSAPST
jgi:hypothetical protein